MKNMLIIMMMFVLMGCGQVSEASNCDYWLSDGSPKWHSDCKDDDKIDRLAVEITELRREALGEVYGKYYYESWAWKPFYQSDVDDDVNGHVKIFGRWHKKENVLFYADPYEARKKRLEEKVKKETK